MAKVQKVYAREFKEQAVQLAQTSGKPITQISRELGISDTSIHQWRKELAAHGKASPLASHHDCSLSQPIHNTPWHTIYHLLPPFSRASEIVRQVAL
jgi:transposase